jgi:hypothetical protein
MKRQKLNYSRRDFCGLKLTPDIQKHTYEMYDEMKTSCIVMHPLTPQHFKAHRYLYIPCTLTLKTSAFYPQSILTSKICTFPSFSSTIQLVFHINENRTSM